MARNIIVGISGWKRSGKDTAGEEMRLHAYKVGNGINVHIMSFSQFFKDAISVMFDYDEHYLEMIGIGKEDILPDSSEIFEKPKSYRDLLIDIGEGLKEILGQNLWANTMKAKIKRESWYSTINEESREKYLKLHPVCEIYEKNFDNLFIITDIRFHKEFEMLEELAKEGYEVHKLWVYNEKTTPKFAQMIFDKIVCKDIYTVDTVTEYIKKNFPEAHRSEYEWLFHMEHSTTIINNGTLEELYSQVHNYTETILKEEK